MTRAQVHKFVDLSGYGFSGRSAISDLLREFRGYYVPPATFEFDLLRIQGGILDLEDNLCRDWSPIRSDAAIRRFKRLVRRLATKTLIYDPRTWFAGMGWNYDEYFQHRFSELSNQYVDRLVDASWVTDWDYPRADLCDIEVFVRRLARKLGVKWAYDFQVFLSFPSDFVTITREYLDELLSSNVGEGVATIVLHNAFEPFQPQRALKFFERAKCIIVDRDPRDSYIQQLTYRPMAVGARDFIARYRVSRDAALKFSVPDQRILRMRFEDLVLDYERTVSLILDHLGEENGVHAWPRRYFDPTASRRNIGLWKAYPRQEEIQEIYRELQEYCFELG